MNLDVVDLRDFYATSLGSAARRMVRRQVRALWPDLRGMSMAGFGYATPYLRPFMDEAARVTAIMPTRIGVMAWPERTNSERNLATVAREDEIPLPDLSIDRVLIVHGLEHSENAHLMLREMWRILSDGGRMIVAVPNRRSIWARTDHTPFGHGHPYSPMQLNRALRQSMFTPVRETRALFFPPSRRRFWLSAAPAWERIGMRWLNPVGGVAIVEVTKQIYGGVPAGAKARRRSYATVPASAGSMCRGANCVRSGIPPAR
ncbi:MAG: methyltransferase type 11 [Alphaproteobacteria bacterium]|nr:methyltransferase type 11 [Alphaproteobacteria bacterium]|tara:strand:- start:194 stop:973 length:780 start_codon:yes stop_codon:yes gene_type:complete